MPLSPRLNNTGADVCVCVCVCVCVDRVCFDCATKHKTNYHRPKSALWMCVQGTTSRSVRRVKTPRMAERKENLVLKKAQILQILQ